MEFEATEDQVKQIAANAANASRQLGLGFLHSGADVTAGDIEVDENFGGGREVSLDYVNGRCVKLTIWKVGENDKTGVPVWKIGDRISGEYQTWMRKYPTAKTLVASVLQPKEAQP